MIHRTLAIILALLVGAAFAQVPEFGQQYRQRLGGAIGELQAIIAGFDQDAKAHGLDRQAALARLRQNQDLVVQDQAVRMAGIAARLDKLEAQDEAYRTAGPFGRLVAILDNYDPTLVEGTLASYEPAIPTTLEGAVTAGAGFFATLIVLSLGGQTFALVFRRRRRTA
ncbi:DUF2937 family protein [Segnochrobactrum spirostomi]|uniref:DUF2937 family protein n=1 Tax=Segnochrobactrum spirostomi TaxID=2608987 RepID=A0A6A7Y3Q8_9HYPH|nr:DUF2937 family protein [Segnochrobactrum spirostomi]MQT13345.1 DUF2937 family protein [Segnochrobactrum spirostomi]